MKQEVLITLRGTQTCAGEKPETVELMTRGTMTGRNGKFAISYEETELTGVAGTTTTFLILNPNRVVLSREGAIRSRMVFEEGCKHEALYDLGFGSLLICICASEIAVDLHDDGGTLRIDYTVEVEQALSSHNSYEIRVEPLAHTE